MKATATEAAAAESAIRIIRNNASTEQEKKK